MAAEDNDFVRALRIAPGDPQHVYVSGSTFDDAGNYMHYVAHSRDGGASWERFDVTLEETELDVTLLAVSPSDPDLVLAKATATEPLAMRERLLVSRDGGASWESPLAITSLADVAFAPDGGSVWVAGLEGLWRSQDGARGFERTGNAAGLSYVSQHDGRLFTGGHFSGLMVAEDGVGASDDGGDSFERYMLLREVTAPLECPAGTSGADACVTPWGDWEFEILRPFQNMPDAGASNAGQGGAGTGAGGSTAVAGTGGTAGEQDAGVSSEASGGGCSCSAVKAARPRGFAATAWLGAALAGVLAFSIRSKRSRRARR
jgi:hypothetical protein